jgi:hypothetical protein
MDMQTVIENYGYAAILIGTFLEGETILVLAGLAAHQGYLTLSMDFLLLPPPQADDSHFSTETVNAFRTRNAYGEAK